MKRSTALALLGLFTLGVVAMGATSEGRRGLKAIAAAQVDDVLDTVAVTQDQRRALERLKTFVAAEVDAKVEQLQSLIRCAVNSRSRPARRFLLGAPAIGPISQVHLASPQLVQNWARKGSCTGHGFLPPARGTVAAEWRSCCFAARR
jgi:hypothetical protein